MQTIRDFFSDPSNSTMAKILAGVAAILGVLVALASLTWTIIQICVKISELNEKKHLKKKVSLATNLPNRNPHFIGRDDVLRAIKRGFSNKSAVALAQSVQGLGGVGKSQTVLEYAHRHMREYKDAVWWINAETSLQEDCRKLLVIFGFKSDIFDERAILAEMGKWYHEHDSWLLVFDNAENYDALKPWLPSNTSGHILVTTRDNTCFSSIAEPVNIDVFSKETALDFLLTRTKRSPDIYAKMIVDMLGRLPLALEQAAAYIVSSSGEISFADYCRLLENEGSRVLEEGKPVDYQDAVTKTWKVSVEKLSESAKQLLYLCACVAPDNIPAQLYVESALRNERLPQPLRGILANEITRRNCFSELTKYSFLKHARENFYSMHRLLQKVIQHDAEKDLLCITANLSIFVDALPRDYSMRKHYETFIMIAEHADAVLRIAEKTDDCSHLQIVEQGWRWVTEGHWRLGEYTMSQMCCDRDLALSKKIYGEDSQEVASAYNNFGWLYRDFGKYAEALEMYNRALKIRKKLFGEKHAETATAYNNLGNTYRDMGDYDNAQVMLKKSLRIKKSVLGADDPSTATTYNNLGLLFYHMNEHKNALMQYKKALAISSSFLGYDHPNTATVSYNLGFLYRDMLEYTKAIDSFLRAYRAWLELHGEEHQRTREAYNALRETFILSGGKLVRFRCWLKKALLKNEESEEVNGGIIHRESSRYVSPMEKFQTSGFHSRGGMK